MSGFRVKVYRNGSRLEFLPSLVDILQTDDPKGVVSDNEVKVDLCLKNERLLISCNTMAVNLKRPSFCPFRCLPKNMASEIPQEIKCQGVDVGVALLLESMDHKVLLTRRSQHMRTFPGVWVPPGGHIDKNETLTDAVCRELKEETGVVVKDSSIDVLGLWESTYPPCLEWGLPKRHHIVIYMHCNHSEHSREINKNIKLQIEETDSCIWVSREIAQKIVSYSSEISNTKSDTHKCNDHEIITCSQLVNGGTVEKQMNKTESGNNERISTGTKYALKLWLDKETHS
uniref:m7GpppN-mRNA hydrolase NUDT17 n=1 Tax=Ciona intestinalis TaxID=7719 RepID=H2Y3B4_CIOIN